jgi:hypothetical protein
LRAFLATGPTPPAFATASAAASASVFSSMLCICSDRNLVYMSVWLSRWSSWAARSVVRTASAVVGCVGREGEVKRQVRAMGDRAERGA